MKTQRRVSSYFLRVVVKVKFSGNVSSTEDKIYVHDRHIYS